MSCLSHTIAQSDPSLQELMEKIKNAPSLALLILAALQLGRRVAVKVAEEILNERGQAPDEGGVCSDCGRSLESKGLKRREMITLLGLVKWRRRVRGCPGRCASGQVVASDVALGLQPYQRTSLEVKWLVCALAVFVPFELAAVLFESLTGVKVASKSIWSWVQHSGQRAMTRLEAQLAALSEGNLPDQEAMTATTQSLPLLLGADGVMAPFRPKTGSAKGKTIWREVKVGILVRLGQRLTKTGQQVTHLTQRRLVAVLGDIDELSPRLWLEAVRQGMLSSPQVVWLSDGGRGFWRLFEQRFARYATGILDFYHAAQNLWKGSKAWLDGRTQQAHAWFRTARRLLRRGQANEVLADIEAALALEGLPGSAYQTLTNLYHYLDKHRDHIDYAKFKELGLPIGSGMVESACKWLIQQRFKGVGMRWSEDGFNHLLHLRLAWVNGRFDELFPLTAPPN
ncbi:MAG: ISKra4 family transposase [Chloroflexi bacterium]|nr:ISKra4 family transposase [Chloroflexota bacterium]